MLTFPEQLPAGSYRLANLDEAGILHSPFHLGGWNGSGYWLSPGDRVTLDVYTGWEGMEPQPQE